MATISNIRDRSLQGLDGGGLPRITFGDGTLIGSLQPYINKNLVRGMLTWALSSGVTRSTNDANSPDGVSINLVSSASWILCSSPYMVLPYGTGVVYTVSFYAKTTSGTRDCAVDLFPDTLPQHNFTVDSTSKLYKFQLAVGNNADAANCMLRILAGPGSNEVKVWGAKLESGDAYTVWTAHVQDFISINNPITDLNKASMGYSGDLNATYGSTATQILAVVAAQEAADAANLLLADIASDNKLTPTEKQDTRREWDVVYNERDGIRAKADAYSLTAEKAAYDLAFQNLGNYLNNGAVYTIGSTPPLWITDANLSITTTITGSVFRNLWVNLYSARQTLLNAVIGGPLADGSIDIAKFAAGLEPVSIVSSLPLTKTTELVFFSGKLYRWNGTAYTAEIPAADLTGTIVPDRIGNATLEATKFAATIKPIEVVSVLPGPPHVQGRQVFLTTDNKTYRNTGSGWVSSISSADISGTIADAQIAALDSAKLTGTVDPARIANGTIDATKLASSIKPVEVLSVLPGAPHVEGRVVFLTTDDKLYRNTGSGWVSSISSTDISGTIVDTQIAALAATKLTGSLDVARIASGALDATKFASTIKPIEIVASLPGAPHVQGRTVFLTTDNKTYRNTGSGWISTIPAADITGVITNTQIDSLAATKITGTISDTQIGAVSTTKLSGTITGTQIADNAVTTEKIAANSITAKQLVLTDFSNFALNSDFASGNAVGWGYNGQGNDSGSPTSVVLASTLAAPFASAPTKYIGTKTLTTSTSNDVIAVPSYIPCQPGDEFYFEVYVTGPVTCTSVQPYARVFSVAVPAGNPVLIAGTSTTALSAAVNAGWTKISGTYKVAAGYNQIHAGIRVINPVSGTLYFTAFKMRRMASAELIVDGSVVASKIAANAVTADAIAANTITTGKLLVTGRGAALNDDPAMSDSSAWFGAGSSIVTVTDGVVGKTALQCSTGVSQTVSRMFAIAPSKTYRVQLWARTVSGTGTMFARIQRWNASDVVIGLTSGIENIVVPGTWTKYTGTVTTEATTVSARLTLDFNYPSGTAIIQVQGFSATEMASAELIVDGSIVASKVAAGSLTANELSIGTVSENLIYNGNPDVNDVGGAGWYLVQGVAGALLTTSTGISGMGSKRFNMTQNAAGSGYGCRPFAVTPGKTYVFKFRAMGSSATAAGRYVRVIYRDVMPADGIVTFANRSSTISNGFAELAIGNSAWTNVATDYSYTWTCPAGISVATFALYSWVGGPTDLYFDNVEIYCTSAATTIRPGTISSDSIAANSITAGQIAAGAIGADQIAAGSIRTDKLLVTGQGAALNADPMCVDSSAWLLFTGTAPTFISGLTDIPGGTTAMSQPAGTTGRHLTKELIPLDLAKNYRFQAYFKQLTSTAADLYLSIAWYSESGAYLTASTLAPAGWTNGTFSYNGAIGAVLPTTWTQYSLSFGPGETAKSPSGAKFFRAGFILNNTVTPGATVLATGVRVMEKTGADLIVDGSIVSEKIATNAITANKIAAGEITAGKLAADSVAAVNIVGGTITGDKIAGTTITATNMAANSVTFGKVAAGAIGADQLVANSVTAGKLAIGDFTNLVANGTFSLGSANWTMTPGCSINSDSVNALFGREYVFVSLPDANTSYPQNQAIFPVTPGEKFHFEYWGKASGTLTGTCGVYISWKDRTGQQIATNFHTSITNQTVWTKIEKESQAPANAVVANIGLYSSNTAGTAYIGEVVLRRKNAGQLIVDGTITSNKIATGAITANQISANAITASKLFIGDTSNMYKDYDMVDDSFYSGDAGYLLSLTGYASTGRRRLQLPVSAGSITVVSSWQQCEEVADYNVSLVAGREQVGDTATGAAYIEFGTLSAAGVVTFSRNIQVANGSVAVGRQNLNVTTIAGERMFRMKFVRYAGLVGTLTYGGIVVRRRANGSLIVDGAITAVKIAAETITANELASDSVTTGKIAAGAIGAEQIQAGAITTAKLYVTGQGAAINADPAMSDATAWIGSGSSIVSVEDGVSWATALQSSDTSSTVIGKEFALVPSKKYRVQLWARRLYGTGTMSARLQQRTSNGSNITASLTLESITVPTSWQFYRTSLTTASNTARGYLNLQFNSPSGNAVIQVQGFSVTEMADVDLIVDGAITADKIGAGQVTAGKLAANSVTAGTIVAGAVGADQIAANAITAKKLAIGDFSNLVRDPLMVDPDAWDGGTVSWTAAPESAWGSTNVAMLSGSGSYAVVNSSPVSVQPGEVYYLGWQGQVISGGGFCYVDLQTSAWSTFADSIFQHVGTISAYSLTAIGGRLTIPAGHKYARVRLIKHNVGIVSCYIGGVMLRRAMTGELVVDGSITADKIQTGAIVAGKIQAGAINAANILVDGVITANKLNVTNLGAITANITSELVMSSTGAIRSGQTSYDYGSGYWLGLDGGTPKFSIGYSAGSKLTWNGSALTMSSANIIGGSLVVGPSPALSGSTMTGAGAVINSNGTFALGNSTTNIAFNGSTIALNGPVVTSQSIVGQAATAALLTENHGNAVVTLYFNITAADVPPWPNQAVQILITGSVDMNTGSNMTIRYDFNGSQIMLLNTVVTAGVSSYTALLNAGIGSYAVHCYDNSWNNSLTKQRSISAIISKR